MEQHVDMEIEARLEQILRELEETAGTLQLPSCLDEISEDV